MSRLPQTPKIHILLLALGPIGTRRSQRKPQYDIVGSIRPHNGFQFCTRTTLLQIAIYSVEPFDLGLKEQRMIRVKILMTDLQEAGDEGGGFGRNQ